ncbi:MAG: IS110 family transposase, partial [Crocinitomicaceae bacterium]|nr:IS110 family transposase [Crocinitomicaceae bacterium]
MSKVIGIDISKQTFDVSFLEKNQWNHFQFENSSLGFKAFMKLLTDDDKVIMEASGVYYLPLATYLYEQGIAIVVENPLVIKRFSQANLYRAKTDKKDAQTIAEYGCRFGDSLKLWKAESSVVIKLRQIYTRIQLLDKQIHQTNRQLEAFHSSGTLDNSLKKEITRILNHLQNSKDKLEEEMIKLGKAEYQETMECLQTIPGIGPKSAILLCIITGGFSKFEDAKQLTAYVGFSPRIYQSGTSVKGKGHICKMGKAQIRKVLYMCSWTAKFRNKQCA